MLHILNIYADYWLNFWVKADGKREDSIYYRVSCENMKYRPKAWQL